MAISATTRRVTAVRDTVYRQFGDEAGVQITEADIIRWVNMGCTEIVSSNPILKKTIKTNVIFDQAEYDLPADIQRVEWISYDGQPLELRSFGEVRAQNSLSPFAQAGNPEFWYMWGDKLTLYPKPNKNITQGLAIYYSASPAVVDSLGDLLPIPDRLFNRLVEYVLQQAHELDEDWAGAAAKAAQYQQGMASIADEENQQGTGYYPTITVLPEDL